jgi:hypothetical protein
LKNKALINRLVPDHVFQPFAGKLNPLFLFSDNLTLAESQEMPRGFLPCSEAERLRLVKASKSPTGEETLFEREVAKHKFLTSQMVGRHNHQHMLDTGECSEPVYQEHESKPLHTPLNSTGCRAVIEFKEWADEWRLRTETDGQNLQPPEQSGSRVSEMLSHRGARKIAESAAYMAAVKGGYKTFVTGTFDDNARERVACGETTVQKEVSRLMDSMQKMYSRGWVKDDGKKVEGISGGLAYCWVVEVPKNEHGEDNPHVHMLLGWSVKYCDFESWAARIERMWGNGYFHLEKIKDSTCAGAYMSKAAGYLSKSNNDDGSESQGIVNGNRYSISACARAPEWETYAVQQLHIASQLIVDVYDHLTVKHGEKFAERKRLNNALSKIPKEKKGVRQRIGKKLAAVRESLNELPIRCNKYQVIVKGKGNAMRFLSWATNDEHDYGNDWLPEKPEGMAWDVGNTPKAADSLYHTKLRASIKAKVEKRKLWRRLVQPEWIKDACSSLAFWHQVKDEYENDHAANCEYEIDRDEGYVAWCDYSLV